MRLTNDMRDGIVRKVISKTFEAREAALAAESNHLAVLAYDHIYQPDIHAKMMKLPAEFFYQTSRLFIRLAAKSDRIEVNLSSSRRISARDNQYKLPCWELDASGCYDVIKDRVIALVGARQQVQKDVDILRSATRKMLVGITTFKRLREEWPDGSEFYKGSAPAPAVANLPAVRGVDLTSMIMSLGETL